MTTDNITTTPKDNNWTVCLIKKFSWRNFFLLSLSSILQQVFFRQVPNNGNFNKYWILILNNNQIHNVTYIGVDDNPRDWFDSFVNGLTTKSQDEINEIYFQDTVEELENKYGWLKKRKPLQSFTV